MCALFTDGRFSGGSSGLVIGHASPEAAEGGTIGLVEDGDVIEIDIPRRKMHLAVSDEVLARRREAMNAREKAWEPVDRERVVSLALQAYAALATSADRGRCGIFRSSSRSVEGLGFGRRRLCGAVFGSFGAGVLAVCEVVVFTAATAFAAAAGASLSVVCWRFVGRRARRGCSRPRSRSGAFAPDFPRRAPSSSRCRLRRLPSDSSGASRLPRPPPEGLRLSRDVALLEPWSVARLTSPETGRAGGRFLHTWWLASWGVGCGGACLAWR